MCYFSVCIHPPLYVWLSSNTIPESSKGDTFTGVATLVRRHCVVEASGLKLHFPAVSVKGRDSSVGLPIEKPGATLTWVWVPRGHFSLSQFPVQTLLVSVQPPCAIACINSCAHVKHPKHWQPYDMAYHCLGTWRCCTHQEEQVVLFSWLLCPTKVRQPKFPTRDSEVLITIAINQ